MSNVTAEDTERVSKNVVKKADKTTKKVKITAEKKAAAGDASAEIETEDFAKDNYGNRALI